MTNPITPATVPVTAADRQTYLALNTLPEKYHGEVMRGGWDGTTGMQAIARHRIAAEKEALEWAAEEVDWWTAATAIRALIPTEPKP